MLKRPTCQQVDQRQVAQCGLRRTIEAAKRIPEAQIRRRALSVFSCIAHLKTEKDAVRWRK